MLRAAVELVYSTNLEIYFIPSQPQNEQPSTMHMNKRIGRLKQWAGERMGGEVKTCQSDDFKAMETEMGVRHEGEPFLSSFPVT